MTSVNDVLGARYRLVRLLGRGGMSDVYEAVDERSGTTVALKIVRSGDPEYGRRLAQEAAALESFEHPGLIRLLDTGLAGDQAFLVMELIDGPTLSAYLRDGPLSSRDTADLGARLADALAYVHQRGIVHRDVKPSNILLASNGDAWLGDFGIARLHDTSTMTVTGTTMGTVSYMAPEQLEDHQVGPAADIWSLGIVLLECLTGQRAYGGTPSEVVARRMAGPVPLPDDLPAPWKLVLTGMLDHQPDQRLDGAEVASLLAAAAFDPPWSPSDSDATTRLDTMDRSDRTVLMPGAAAASVGGDETRLIRPARTVATAARSIPPRTLAISGAAALLVLGIVLFFVFDSTPSKKHPASTTRPPVTTTAPTTTTTLPGASALAMLESDVGAGQTAGSIDPADAQVISQQARLARTNYLAGNTGQAAHDLQQAAMTIANGVASGAINQSQGAVIQSDLAVLASALNLASASTPPTTTSTTSTSTTTTTAPLTGIGNGNGNGNGNGFGN
jgi:serine/threonine protein kinase